ncbi:MAG: single-stranded-DNA-specific exonuclease RecJ [Pseudomonadota bacterium]
MRILRREIPLKNNDLSGKLHPVLERVYLARGVDRFDDLNHRLNRLHHRETLGGLVEAASLTADAIAQHQRIVIVGDFDADGATGSALAMRGLAALGAADLHFRVPNRFADGYGLTPSLVAHLRDLSPDLIVTVDNGIASLAGTQAARDLGMQVVITDHHLPGPKLPAANAVVNPNLPDDHFPSKHLAGVGVMFYLLAAVRAELVDRGVARAGDVNLGQWLDLVALGTVADLVQLDVNNRILVENGLRRMRAGRCVPGISALAQAAGRDLGRATAADLGFGLAPRLNAAGRLEDMAAGIECLTTDDPDRAASLAAELDRLNSERRSLQDDMQAQALEVSDGLAEAPDWSERFSLSLWDPQWHQGIVGLVASRLKDRHHRPVVAFAPEAPGAETWKGSARSIRGFHIRDAIAEVDARAPGLIQRFGGHAMAAGLTLSERSLAAFEAAFETVASQRLEADQLTQTLRTDGPLSADDLSAELAQALASGGPWGQGFAEPQFDNPVSVVTLRGVGRGHSKMRVKLDGVEVDAIAFGYDADHVRDLGHALHLVFALELNEFRGRQSLQLNVRHLQPA